MSSSSRSILKSAGTNQFLSTSATEVLSRSMDEMDANCLIGIYGKGLDLLSERVSTAKVVVLHHLPVTSW